MADPNDHDPATRADLAGLTRTVLEATNRHRAEQREEMRLARGQRQAETAQLAALLRTELSHVRHDFGAALDTAAAHLETLIDERTTRALTVALLSQVLIVVILATLGALLT